MNAPVRIPGEPAPPGDNLPSPYDLSCEQIEGLFLEASNWCDGSGVQSQADADAVDRLLIMIRNAINIADARRKDENAPFDAGKADVQARYNALIGDTKSVKGRAILALDACRKAIQPWRQRQEAERQAAAEAARKAAEEADRTARLAHQLSSPDDLDARVQAEDLTADAKVAAADARRAAKPVATGLRTVVRAEVTDHRTFLRWVAENRPDALRGALQSIAESLSHAKLRDLPGVVYHQERVAR